MIVGMWSFQVERQAVICLFFFFFNKASLKGPGALKIYLTPGSSWVYCIWNRLKGIFLSCFGMPSVFNETTYVWCLPEAGGAVGSLSPWIVSCPW